MAPRTYGRLGRSTSRRRPWSSKISSSSRWLSKASAYWKPEQPPPRTPTRRPEVDTSAPCEARNSLTFSAPLSVKVITGSDTPRVSVRRSNASRSVARIADLARLGGHADDGRAQGPDRECDPGRARGRRRPPRGWRPLPRRGLRPRIRGHEPDRAAPPGLRGLRSRDRRPDPCAVP